LKSLYRFLGFASFVDLVQRRSLAFAHYKTWPDPFEGFLLRAIETPEGRAKIERLLTSRNYVIPGPAATETLKLFCDGVHIQCWTRLPESDAMWRIFGPDRFAVRIEAARSDLAALGGLKVLDVAYGNLTLDQELKRVFPNSREMLLHEVFTSKRRAFEHELETRLITDMDNSLINSGAEPMPANWPIAELLDKMVASGGIDAAGRETVLEEVERRRTAKPWAPTRTKYVSIEHARNLIRSVLVHPQADAWFVDTVEHICRSHDVPFAGQSDLYRFRVAEP
jgi:hypothetical protein